MIEVGDKIKIFHLDDPYAKNYIGKEGIVTSIQRDPWGDIRYEGTWGGVALYPKCDDFTVIEKHK